MQVENVPAHTMVYQRYLAVEQRFIALVQQYDHKRLVIAENLKAEYILVFGHLEMLLFEETVRRNRLRRKIALVQAMRNRQEKVDEEAIEKQLEKEFLLYKQMLAEKKEEIDQAKARKDLDKLSEQEFKELKQLYRYIVKNLHPDIIGSKIPQEKELFQMAVDAYKGGDLDGLRVVADVVHSLEDTLTIESNRDSLELKITQLEKSIEKITLEMEKLDAIFPFNKKELLEDEEEKEAHLRKLKENIETFQASSKELEEYLKTIIAEVQ